MLTLPARPFFPRPARHSVFLRLCALPRSLPHQGGTNPVTRTARAGTNNGELPVCAASGSSAGPRRAFPPRDGARPPRFIELLSQRHWWLLSSGSPPLSPPRSTPFFPVQITPASAVLFGGRAAFRVSFPRLSC